MNPDTEHPTLKTTLPGDIPGLLRRGAPVLVNGRWRATVIGDDADQIAGEAGPEPLPEDAQLDLTDRIGLFIASLWARSQLYAEDSPLTDQQRAILEYLVLCASRGMLMSEAEIDTFASLILVLAGRGEP